MPAARPSSASPLALLLAGLGLAGAPAPAWAQSCQALCELEFQGCAELKAAGCNLAGQGAEQLANQALSNVPYGGLAAALIGNTAKSTCKEKLAPCQTVRDNCVSACGGGVVPGAVPVAAATTSLILYMPEGSARVYIDGKRAGRGDPDPETPYESPPLTVGEHAVRVEVGEGTEERHWEGTVSLVGGEINSVEVGALRSPAWWALQAGAAALVADEHTSAMQHFAEAHVAASATASDRSEAEAGLLDTVPRLAAAVLTARERRARKPADAWAELRWAPGTPPPIDPSDTEGLAAVTAISGVRQTVDSAAVAQACDAALDALQRRLEDEAHGAWVVVEGMDGNRYAQYGAATAWLQAFPGAPDTATAQETVAHIEALHSKHVAPALARVPGSGHGSTVAAAKVRQEVGLQLSRKARKLERLGMQGFLDGPMADRGFWVTPPDRTTVERLWLAEAHRRPSRALRGWGYGLAWSGIPVVTVGAIFGWESATVQAAAVGSMVGGAMVTGAGPLQARNLHRQYGTAHPTTGAWSDKGLGLYGLSGMSFGLFFISKGMVELRAMSLEPARVGSPATAAANLNQLRTMGFAFAALGATTSVMRHTGLGRPTGRAVAVQVSPFGIQGQF